MINDLKLLVHFVAENDLRGSTAMLPPDGYQAAAKRLERRGLILRTGPRSRRYVPTARGCALVAEAARLDDDMGALRRLEEWSNAARGRRYAVSKIGPVRLKRNGYSGGFEVALYSSYRVEVIVRKGPKLSVVAQMAIRAFDGGDGS